MAVFSLDSNFADQLACRTMSVLDDFARIRLFRKRASEFEWLADNALVDSVRRRYRTIARHYTELADREEESDKARMAERLEQLRLQRQKVAQQAPSSRAGDAQTRVILRAEDHSQSCSYPRLLAAE